MPKVIDGKHLAQGMRRELQQKVQSFVDRAGRQPRLVVVRVGNDAASEIYVRNKVKQAAEAKIASSELHLPEVTSEQELLNTIDGLNANPEVDGILVQLPLPKQISASKVILRIDPKKDVDGFHPMNAGLLASGLPSVVPCTPSAIMRLIQSVRTDLEGANIVVLGRSNIVGKPVANLLLSANCTVTIAHSRSRDFASITSQADVLVVAVGKPELVRGNWIKRGAIVIDVGINRVEGPRGIVGDVAFEEALRVADAITPVPGGVGPMTIACLLENTVIAANSRIS